VVPANSEIFVTEKNAAYMDALARLRAAMQSIAGTTDPAGRQAANQAAASIYESGLDAARQIARGFKPNGLDQVVQRLLEEPIRHTRRFLDADPSGLITKGINDALNQLCKSSGSTLERYPFRRSSTQDAGLDELSALFAPETGQIWKFRAGSLAELTTFENSQWKPKDPSQKPQVTPEILAFLNRAQNITSTLYANGSARPQITYVLRPRLDSNFSPSIVEVEVDGQLHQWTTIFQKQFTWPAAPGAKPGAIARIRTDNVAHAFILRGGVWGIFKMMADAEPRAPQATLIEWKYSRVGDQRVGDQGGDPIQPAPVRMEFPEFPNGVDVFQPQFFDGLRCPAAAVR
jgi:type VI protein secretion system component VasK